MLCGAAPLRAAQNPALERGTAIIDPFALRELDHGRFGLTRILAPTRSADTPLTNPELFALPSMAPVTKALDADFDRYVATHKASLPNETIGVGPSFDFQLFDRALFNAPDARFVLSGIVNRMDRAYVSRENCGEMQADLSHDADERARDRRARRIAAAADDAEHRAQGQSRSCGRRQRRRDHLCRDRPALALPRAN